MGKVIFSDARQTKIVSLPSFEGSEVVVYTSLTIGQQRSLATKNVGDSFGGGIDLVVASIKEWNLTDVVGEPIAITTEAIEALTSPDFTALIEVISGGDKKSKKNS